MLQQVSFHISLYLIHVFNLEFESIDVTYDGIEPPETGAFVGELPDGFYGDNVTLALCCRSDADIGDPITLPTSEPFVLLQKSPLGCQEVVGEY